MIRELADRQNKLIVKRAGELWGTGAFDPKAYGKGDYMLPSAVLSALDKEMAAIYRPLSNEGKALVKNLEHF